jgi:uncharacterized protein
MLSTKDTRYLIRLGHSGQYKPVDQATLLAQIRERLRPIQGQAVNLRVSRHAIEFDLFCAPTAELHSFLTILESVGPVVSYRRLDAQSPEQPAAHLLAEARELFNEERYWEVHEVLEELWKKSSGPEKHLVQGLILTAAALVHAQRNEPEIMNSILDDALLRLEQHPIIYHGLDIRQFANHVKKLKISKSFYFPPI